VIFFEGRDEQEEVPFSGSILNMRAELRSALDNDEFLSYFQPVYSIKDRRLSGFETLVRWMHPRKGFLPPSRFIPYAERIGLVGEIDRCMMRCAMEAIRKSSNTFYFSANGSSNLMQSPDAAALIQDSLNEAAIDPSCFVVEVTESVLIDNLKGVSATLDRLREMGVRIFLDDFGTGYSSLQYIHSLPLDCIKLDIAFVRHVFDSEKEARMLHTIIDMANALNLDTVAEGVETEEQLSWLAEAGCGKAQGFYFSKPLSWADAEKLIRRERAK
ncbi:MAG: EAL domain-containing protein, partial [Fretibacterium sp.]